MIYFEDFAEGDIREFGDITVTHDMIIEYATKYDPQPMHLDEEAGKASILGGLAASGIHTASLMMRMLCDDLLLHAASLGSPGVDELRWEVPVRPGDRLHARRTVKAVRASKANPRMGIVTLFVEVFNEQGRVMWMEAASMFARKETAA